MLTVLWFLYSLSHLIFHTADRNHYAFVPSDANLVVALNTQELIAHGVDDLLFQSQDASIMELLKMELEGRELDGKQLESGIDLSGDILLFTIRYQDRPLTGMLFSLNDEATFQTEMAQMLDPNLEASAHLPNVGLILRQLDTGFSSKELQQICTKLFKGKHLSTSALNGTQSGSISQLLFRAVDPKKATSALTSLDIRLAKNGLEFQGKVDADFSEISSENFRVLAPEGLHISTRLIPVELFDPKILGLSTSLPQLRGLSINFRGSEITNDQFTVLIPDADAILEFESKFELVETLESLAAAEYITHVNASSFHFGTRKFYFRQIDEKTVYIGRNTPGEFGSMGKSTLFDCHGDLSTLTNVQGKGIVRRFLEIMSSFTSSRTFTENTDGFELMVKMKDKNSATIKGLLQMKEGRFAILELLRWALSSDLF